MILPDAVVIGIWRMKSWRDQSSRFCSYHAIVRCRPSFQDNNGFQPKTRLMRREINLELRRFWYRIGNGDDDLTTQWSKRLNQILDGIQMVPSHIRCLLDD